MIATPIGNLEDISARALRLLDEVRLIAAEDTRQTRKLLSHFDIHTPLTSYHEHSKKSKLKNVLEELTKGDVGLVSDAGTPGLNDPGFELVRAALDMGHNVSPVPGPSAPIAALVASGLPTDTFLYMGYLPRKSSQRRQALEKVARLPYTLVFLETPHRLLSSLDDLIAIFGDRQAAVARELTKLHEEIFRGTLPDARRHFGEREPRGEFTLVIAPGSEKGERWDEARVRKALNTGINDDLSPSKLASQIASQSGWPRREVYKILTETQISGESIE